MIPLCIVDYALVVEAAEPGAITLPRPVIVYKRPIETPDTVFVNHASGQSQTLGTFHGKVIIVNLWATWCTSCVIELPTLDQLQKDLGGDKLQVVTISIDKDDVPVEELFREAGWTSLFPGIDRRSELMKSLNVSVIPTSIIIDRQSRQIGRVIGPTLWTDPRMESALKALINAQ